MTSVARAKALVLVASLASCSWVAVAEPRSRLRVLDASSARTPVTAAPPARTAVAARPSTSTERSGGGGVGGGGRGGGGGGGARADHGRRRQQVLWLFRDFWGLDRADGGGGLLLGGLEGDLGRVAAGYLDHLGGGEEAGLRRGDLVPASAHHHRSREWALAH